MKWSEMLDATPVALRSHYEGCRNLAYNNGRMAQHCRPGSRSMRKLEQQMGFLMRQISMLENAAKKARHLARVAAPTLTASASRGSGYRVGGRHDLDGGGR